MYTDFIVLTDLWQNHKYEEISNILDEEDWPRNRLVQFCSYFAKHVGMNELRVLHLFV
jgi:hypothetical protein